MIFRALTPSNYSDTVTVHESPPEQRPTLPQELIDLILDVTDVKSLTACARVARAFRSTSQKHIFAEIRIVPPSRYWVKSKSLTFKAFSRVLAESPHLALSVRSLTLVEGTGVGSARWMRKDAFPEILSSLTSLTSLSIQSDVWLDWDSFPPALIQALQTTVALPSLTSVGLHHLRFRRSEELLSFLHSCSNVNSLVFSPVLVKSSSGGEVRLLNTRLGLASLTLDPSLVPVLHSVRSAFDMQSLRLLDTTITAPDLETETQNLLDESVNLEHLHIRLLHHHTDASNINIQRLSQLRTLELTLFFEFSTSPDNFDPVTWAANILSTTRPSVPIEHIVLNINIDERDLLYLSRLEALERALVSPQMASLHRLSVVVNSFEVDFNIYGCEEDIRSAFATLWQEGMLDMEFRGVS
ncbi:hypothetical protein R3P38DRAFT_2869219 [Favolaschia claudopus]|uniref:F-box domain-containing protein n=1 Tax=Favolaschia claudopus TaxID=2862362 RepID=A0AAW0DB11_9AGAR